MADRAHVADAYGGRLWRHDPHGSVVDGVFWVGTDHTPPALRLKRLRRWAHGRDLHVGIPGRRSRGPLFERRSGCLCGFRHGTCAARYRSGPHVVIGVSRPPIHEGERALFGDNDGVDSRAPGAAAGSAGVVTSLSDKRDERELIASVLRKDRKAAARFVAAHIDAVYAYARHRLSPHADLVDDVVQDVFLAALKGLATFEGQSSLRWLVAIARHKIEDIYRQRLRAALALDMDSTEDEPASNEIPLDEQIDKARADAKTRRVLERMPERYALILLWRYWEQRSARDVAGAIGTTEKSVERLLARARAKFKELWLKE